MKDQEGNSMSSDNETTHFTTKWSTRMIATEQHDYVSGIAAGSSGEVYVTGHINNRDVLGMSKLGLYDAYLVRYESDGIKKWSTFLN